MNRQKLWVAVLAVGGVMTACANMQAATIFTHGFDTTGTASGGTFDGWSLLNDLNVVANAIDTGKLSNGNVNAAADLAATAGMMLHFASRNNEPVGSEGINHATMTLADTYVAGESYSLDVAVSLKNNISHPAVVSPAFADEVDWAIQLLDGAGAVLAETTGHYSNATGKNAGGPWEHGILSDYNLSYTATAADAGNPIQIRLFADSSNGDGAGTPGHAFVGFDNVRLEAGGPDTLQVNSTTGIASLVNGSMTPFDLNWYRISSPTGSLDETGWNSLQDQDLPAFPAGDGSGNGWEELGVATSSLLGEAYLLGDSSLAGNGSISFGSIYDTAATPDLEMQLRLADGTVSDILVEYFISPLGDMDGDGDVDTDDVDPFVQALTDRTAYDAQGYGIDADVIGDFNSNGKLDMGDINAFSAAVSTPPGSASASAVPEPSALVLLGLGLVAFVGRRRK